MAYPAGVITRPVTFGPAFELEDGDVAGMQVTFKATRPGVLWLETGQPAVSTQIVKTADDGVEQVVYLPVTDQDGWGDGDGNLIVPGADGHVFLYIVTVIFTQNGRTIPGAQPRSKVVPIPQGDLTPLDLDKLIPLTTPGGTVVSVPDVWSEQIAAAEAAAVAAAESMIDSDTFMASKADDPTSEFAASLSAKIEPPMARAAKVYLDGTNGSDTKNGKTSVEAVKTPSAAFAALGSAGGVVDLQGTTLTVNSTGRFDSCTFTAGSNVVADASIGAGDVGSRVINTYLRSPLVIATVTPGESFTVTDETGRVVNSESSGTAVGIITKPGLVIPPGVRLTGLGGQWTIDQSAQAPILNKSNSKIKDTGTGIAVMFGHPADFGPANSGQNAVGGIIENVTIEGNAGNLFGLAQINNWGTRGHGVDIVGCGLGALIFSGNANTTRFSDCRFSGNGSATATKIGGGVVHLINTPEIPFGPVKFDNCFSTANYGWHIVGTRDFATPMGARSIRASQGQFNHALASAVAGSGTQIAISGKENRSLLDDCIFESADFLNLDVYDSPVTVIANKFKATGGTNGTLPYTIRVNSGATLEAIGSGFHDSTSHHVQVEAGGAFNWRSSQSGSGSSTLAADASGNPLALTSELSKPAGSTNNPVEPLSGQAGNARANETVLRSQVTSDAVAVADKTLNLTYFTATKNATVTQVAVEVGATPASGGSAAYIGVGLFVVNSNGSLTQIAVTSGANGGAFQTANQVVTLNLAASAVVTQGRRYAIGLLVSTSNALPTFRGSGSKSLSLSGAPAMTHSVAAQTSMPASIATASLVSGGVQVYSRLP